MLDPRPASCQVCPRQKLCVETVPLPCKFLGASSAPGCAHLWRQTSCPAGLYTETCDSTVQPQPSYQSAGDQHEHVSDQRAQRCSGVKILHTSTQYKHINAGCKDQTSRCKGGAVATTAIRQQHKQTGVSLKTCMTYTSV